MKFSDMLYDASWCFLKFTNASEQQIFEHLISLDNSVWPEKAGFVIQQFTLKLIGFLDKQVVLTPQQFANVNNLFIY